MEVQFPIFVLAKDCGEVYEFSSMKVVQRELEAIDVEYQEFEAWDKRGQVLSLIAEGVGRFRAGTIRIEGTGRLVEPEALEGIRKRAQPRGRRQR